LRAALAVFAVLVLSSPAEAFHEIRSFSRTANTGGGAGAYFTGSPRFKGYDCSICHIGAPGRISIQLATDPPELAAGRYEPGVLYRIDVEMVGGHRGLESAFNPNTFALEVTDAAGAEVGSLLTAPTGIMRLADDGRVALAEGFGNGETAWTLHWRSPDSPVPATLHLGAVDGDGASDPERRWIDAPNDDVAIVALSLCPNGSVCPDSPSAAQERSAVQCSFGQSDDRLAPWLLLAVALAIAVTRKKTSPTSKDMKS